MGRYLTKEKGMKNIIITGLSLLLVGVSAQAEVIQSVNFNPARFGQFERLKVSEKATLKGGLKAQSMRVHSAGTINLEETPSAEQGRLAYDIIKLDGSNGYYSLGSSFPDNPTLSFPSTCFSSMENCVDATNTGALKVAFSDGKARFRAPNNYSDNPSSRIRQITTNANLLRLEALYATIQGKLYVTGNGGYTFRNGASDTPLRLAGNWIPLPSASGAPTGSTLTWETRKTVKYANRGGEQVRVLVLKGQNTSSSCNKTCPTRACPNGKSGKITYKLNTTTCTCEEVSNTCGYKYVLMDHEVQMQYEMTADLRGAVDYTTTCRNGNYSNFCREYFYGAKHIEARINEYSSRYNENYRVAYDAEAGRSCSTPGEIVFNPNDKFCFYTGCIRSTEPSGYNASEKTWCITDVNNPEELAQYGMCKVTVFMHGVPYKCQ